MSAKYTAYVLEFSPYTGAAFAIHLCLADVANDGHEQRFWMKQDELATKARTTRQTVSKTINRMIDDGFLEQIEDNSRTGYNSANVYRLLTPDVDQVYDTTRIAGKPDAELKKHHAAKAPAVSFRKNVTSAQRKSMDPDDSQSALELGLDTDDDAEIIQFDGSPGYYDPGADESSDEHSEDDGGGTETIGVARGDTNADDETIGVARGDTGCNERRHPLGVARGDTHKNSRERNTNSSAYAEEADASSVASGSDDGVTDEDVIEAEVVSTEADGNDLNEWGTDDVVDTETVEDEDGTEGVAASDTNEVVDAELVREDTLELDIVPVPAFAVERDDAIADGDLAAPAEYLPMDEVTSELDHFGVDPDDTKAVNKASGKVLGAYIVWRDKNLGSPMQNKWKGDVRNAAKKLIQDGFSPLAAFRVVMHWHDQSLKTHRETGRPLAPGAIHSIAQGFRDEAAAADQSPTNGLYGIDGSGRSRAEKAYDDALSGGDRFAQGF